MNWVSIASDASTLLAGCSCFHPSNKIPRGGQNAKRETLCAFLLSAGVLRARSPEQNIVAGWTLAAFSDNQWNWIWLGSMNALTRTAGTSYLCTPTESFFQLTWGLYARYAIRIQDSRSQLWLKCRYSPSPYLVFRFHVRKGIWQKHTLDLFLLQGANFLSNRKTESDVYFTLWTCDLVNGCFLSRLYFN